MQPVQRPAFIPVKGQEYNVRTPEGDWKNVDCKGVNKQGVYQFKTYEGKKFQIPQQSLGAHTFYNPFSMGAM